MEKLSGIKAIIFDADGTLLEVENPYLALSSYLECESQVRDMVKEYLVGKLNYTDLVDKETILYIEQYRKIFGRVPQLGDLEKFLPHPKLRPHVAEVIPYLLSKNVECHVLSSGFTYLTEDLSRLKLPLENIHANRLLYDSKGQFVMIKIDVTGDKINGFEQILLHKKLNPAEVVYVGDNAFDEILMKVVLENEGYVFFIEGASTDFNIKELPKSENFRVLKHIEDLKEFF